ncbi:MAG: hypothetical protein RL385_2008, partial [Pseudomonadota bacterium]
REHQHPARRLRPTWHVRRCPRHFRLPTTASCVSAATSTRTRSKPRSSSARRSSTSCARFPAVRHSAPQSSVPSPRRPLRNVHQGFIPRFSPPRASHRETGPMARSRGPEFRPCRARASVHGHLQFPRPSTEPRMPARAAFLRVPWVIQHPPSARVRSGTHRVSRAHLARPILGRVARIPAFFASMQRPSKPRGNRRRRTPSREPFAPA